VTEQPTTPDPTDTAPEPGAVVLTRHRDHRFSARGRRITVRLDDDELAAIELAAGRAGLTPTGYVGAVALAAARGTVPPAPSQSQQALAELMAARTQLRRFGTNVNQAVAALHATGEAPEWLAQAVEVTARAVRRVDEAAAALMRRRG
jgi:ABC-type transporter Mla subunit MlaD